MTALSGPAVAQDDDNPVLEEIQVTGSRIRRTDFETPNPVTVIDQDFMQNLGIINAGDALQEIPSNVSTFTPQATGNSNFFAGSTIANLRGINPYFGSRTLTLIDGRRHVPTSQGDSVDLNIIPTILMQRMDVVTGGASAAYGSGAISGVNNVILDKRLEGLKLDLDYGISDEGDGDNYHGALAWGTSVMDGRGHLVLAGEYEKQEAVGCDDARDWCAENVGFLGTLGPDNVTPLDPNLPSNVLASNRRFNGVSDAGVFWNTNWGTVLPTPAVVPGVTADGTGVADFALGQNAIGQPSASGGGTAIGGDGISTQHYTNLIGETERKTFHGHFDYDITDTINFGIDGAYAKVTSDNRTQATTNTASGNTALSIAGDNAYILQQALAGNMALANAQAATAVPNPFNPFAPPAASLNKDWTSQLDSHSTFNTEVWSIVGDLNGQFGDSSWTWDAYVSHGHTKRGQTVFDNPHLTSLKYAVDAVFPYIDPTNPFLGIDVAADPVCRVTRDGAAAFDFLNDPTGAIAQGCVPLNPFGTGEIDQAAHDYAFGYLKEQTTVNQTVAAANVSGDLFEGFGAGPVSAAVGGEYRWENIDNRNLSAEPAADYGSQYGEPFKGKVDVWETYGEISVPVVSGMTMFENLRLDGAIRYSHYKNTGQGPIVTDVGKHGLTTWKVSGVWDVTSWVRIRGSQSRDSRAGNFRELYYGQIIASGGTFGYCGEAFFTDPCTIFLQGNPQVKPEKSDTSTLGVVFSPSGALDGLQFAADYFRINLKNGIAPAGAQLQTLIADCRELGQAECSTDLGSIVFDADSMGGDPSTWTVQEAHEGSYNASSYKVKGIDFSLSYNHTFDGGDMISARALATKTFHQKVVTALGAAERDIVGQTGTGDFFRSFLADFQSAPDWTGNISVTYTHGGFSGTVQGRYTSKGTYDYLGAEPGDANYDNPDYTTYETNKVPFYQVYNLNLSYTFEDLIRAGSTLQVYANVNNVFDKDPNPLGSATYFDRLGRMFRFGIRSTF